MIDMKKLIQIQQRVSFWNWESGIRESYTIRGPKLHLTGLSRGWKEKNEREEIFKELGISQIFMKDINSQFLETTNPKKDTQK